MSDNNEKEHPTSEPASASEASGQDAMAPAPGESPEQKTQSTPAKPSRAALGLALLALIGLGAASATAYWYGRQVQSSLKQVNDSLVQLDGRQGGAQGRIDSLDSALQAQQQAFDSLNRAFESQTQQLKGERSRLEQREAAMKAELEAVHRRIGRSSSQWMAAEAEYLMRVANHRLRLERDVPTALEALQLADGRLEATADPGWIPAREELANEMAALRTLAKIDTTGMSAALASLAGRVDRLHLVGSRPLVFAGDGSPETTGEGGQVFSWQQILEDGWNGFRSMMVIRRLDEPVTAMLPPEQHYFVHQNLRLQLEAARFALLRHDAPLYQSSLATARDWIREFVVPEDAEGQVMLEEIERLAQIDIVPALPDISGSLRLLREQLENAVIESPAP